MAKNRLCSISGCSKKHYAKGMCLQHYNRLRTHGDLVIKDRTPFGEPYLFYKEVVLNHRADECLKWPYSRTKRGYGKMWLDGKLQYVHRLACAEANGPAPSEDHQAAHSCGKGHEACVALAHLSWKTRLENECDKLTHGTIGRGELCGTSKLTEQEVKQIRALKGSVTQEEIASRFGVKREAISKIHRRETWFHI